MPKKIDEELKARAVRLVTDHLGEYPSLTGASAAVAKQVGVGKESVRRWVVQAQVDGEPTPRRHQRGTGGDQDAQGEGSPARRGQRDLEGRDGFLRRGTRPPQPLIMGFIDTMRAEGHAVESICRILREQGCQIAARTYRSWKRPSRALTARTVSDAHVVDAVRDVAWVTDRQGPAQAEPRGALRPAEDDGLPASHQHVRGQRRVGGPGDEDARPGRGAPRQGHPDHDPSQGRHPGRVTCSTATSPRTSPISFGSPISPM